MRHSSGQRTLRTRERRRCSREDSDGPAPQVNFLARHEYEVALTTEVAVRHSSTEWETATVTERIGFVTSGPPGLNETPEPGLELAPYVVSRPPGGRGLTYREESVHVVLSDTLRMFGPGLGGAEADNRLPITLVIESAFDASPDAHAGKGSRASTEWFLANRGDPDPSVAAGVLDIVRARARGGPALRYQRLTEASNGSCPPDAVWTEQQPWVAVSPFRTERPRTLGSEGVLSRHRATRRKSGRRPGPLRGGRHLVVRNDSRYLDLRRRCPGRGGRNRCVR